MFARNLTITGVSYNTKSIERILRLKEVQKDPKVARFNRYGTESEARPASHTDLEEAERQFDLMIQWRDRLENERQSSRDIQALTGLFERLRQVGKTRRLENITLDVVIYRDTIQRLKPKDGGT